MAITLTHSVNEAGVHCINIGPYLGHEFTAANLVGGVLTIQGVGDRAATGILTASGVVWPVTADMLTMNIAADTMTIDLNDVLAESNLINLPNGEIWRIQLTPLR